MLIALIAKIAGATLLFYLSDIQTVGTFWSNPNLPFNWPQDQVLVCNTAGNPKWPLTFIGWDSAWYLTIMAEGYTYASQSFTFSPALPFFGQVGNMVVKNPVVSIVTVSLVFGVLLIPLFQILAENYLNKKTALLSTLLFVFTPYVFVFTTVTYSESLMLFFILAAWVLAAKGRMIEASAFAIVAPLTRSMGILVVIPMLFHALKDKNRRVRNVFLSLLPLISLGAWFFSLGLITGVPLAPISTTEWEKLWTIRTLITNGIPQYGISAILQAPYQLPPIVTHWLLPSAILVALIVPLLLFSKLWHKDKLLWLYALAGYLGILWFGAIVSLPRFISVIFPFYIIAASNLSGSKKSIIIVIGVLAVFYVLAMDLWLSFLNGEFIA